MRTVFVIGDEITRKLVQLTCHSFDIHVELLRNTHEFLVLSRLLHPLMVVIDASGPMEEEGVYLAWCMKSDSKLHRIPLIGLSDSDYRLDDLRDAPCDFCFKKPLPIPEIRDVVQRLLDAIEFAARSKK